MIDEKEILRRVAAFRLEEKGRLCRLRDYYRGKHPILGEKKAPGKPDHHLVNNFCRAITDSTVGYFMGQAPTYSHDDPASEAAILRISRASEEEFVLSALARDISALGRAAELLWYDAEKGVTRFSPLDVTAVIPLWDDSVEENLIGAIRILSKTDERGVARDVYQVYDKWEVATYREEAAGLVLLERHAHGFSDVPVNFYKNNRDESGDFESVISLVDAYNRLQSESVNDFELFADSYLAVSGMGGTTEEDLARLRRDRVLLLDEGGEAKWITKSVSDSYIEHLKDRIARDIYRFSATVDMEESGLAGGQLSGVAIRYRLLHFDNRVRITEQFFRKALARRWKLVADMEALMGTPFDAEGMVVSFSRNLPTLYSDAAELASALEGIVSRRTLLEMLPFVKDPLSEEARLAQEALGASDAG